MTFRLYARAEVVRRLRLQRGLLERLEAEQVVRSRRGGFTADDVERLRVAAEMIELGVNPEGVEVIVRMRESWLAERRELKDVIDALRSKWRERRG